MLEKASTLPSTTDGHWFLSHWWVLWPICCVYFYTCYIDVCINDFLITVLQEYHHDLTPIDDGFTQGNRNHVNWRNCERYEYWRFLFRSGIFLFPLPGLLSLIPLFACAIAWCALLVIIQSSVPDHFCVFSLILRASTKNNRGSLGGASRCFAQNIQCYCFRWSHCLRRVFFLAINLSHELFAEFPSRTIASRVHSRYSTIFSMIDV